ncbi:uncharacterized protein LOC112905857 [Agrilus planipennis]|uniref:Uncharacterized protein LOC112905857 n=1 Tax=Agrilus planipennis TaxID=224129 RepID=A0A7F5RFX7_AGRPL|nr:uncharacterized protein LOC112905857 [Agrilus planipennis]
MSKLYVQFSLFAGVLKDEYELETRSVLSNTINKTVESIRVKLSEYDPISLTDKSISLLTLGNFSVKKLQASGFSNFAIKSLSANVLSGSVKGTFNLPHFSAVVESAAVSSKIPKVDAEVSSLTVDLVGTTVQFSLKYSVLAPHLSYLWVLPQIKGLNLELKGNLNGQDSEITIDTDEMVENLNKLIDEYQTKISNTLKDAINYLLGLRDSSSSIFSLH